MQIMRIVVKELCMLFVEPVAQTFTMSCLKEKKQTFTSFPEAIAAIDVTFQQAN